jgi:hypothetical protein
MMYGARGMVPAISVAADNITLMARDRDMRTRLLMVLGVLALAQGTPAHAQVALTDDVVAAVQKIALNTPYGSLPRGLDDSFGGTTRLFVVSSRNMIAARTADAAGSRGRFVPPPDMRQDFVHISCGDHDLGEIFECSRLRVLVDGKQIAPVTYNAGPKAYRNALGATWSVREVAAVYDARRLTKGFTVEYASPNGGQWTFTVAPDQAAVDLLLDVTLASTATASAGPTPNQLRVTVTRIGDGWEITNDDDYRWPRCVVSSGVSEAEIGAFAPNATITVVRTQFKPALTEQSLQFPVSLTCYVGRQQMFIATERR